MGTLLFDQYSLLHFASGVIAYFFGISFEVWILLHIVFELTENTESGMKIINTYLKFWPGGKPKPDTTINSLGDVISGAAGWLVAYKLDELGDKFGWYEGHLVQKN